MTATYDLTTDVGKVRLLIADTDVTPAADAHFTDEELETFLELADDDIYIAAALALESWAATMTAHMESEKIGDYSYTRKQVENKLALAKQYRDNSSSGTIMDWAEMDLASIGELDEEDEE